MTAPAAPQSQTNKRKTLDSFFSVKKKNKMEKQPGDAKIEAPASAVAPAPSNETNNDAESSSAASSSKEASDSSPAFDPSVIPEDQRAALRLELETIDGSWLVYLVSELTKPYFTRLKAFLRAEHDAKKTIFPPPIDLYSWSRFCSFPRVRVVVLGQDPYHGPGQAHGLAFSVRPGVRVPPSLLNMYKALERDIPGFARPTHGYLRGWAEQGVLLLNASLTVECHKANSHANRGWEEFTDAVIKLVNDRAEHVVFMLWGSYAQKKGARVDSKRHLVLKSVHPSPLSASRGFFDAGHFRKANEYLRSHGHSEIDWARLPKEEE
ncbi:uracil DNA glycosylase [Coemansia erecta]|uniref:Uracil-DNA glycosylase n=1 Tax=Coemansia erecta TaxID=147472 RepID=A0A9W7XWL6_9FUNG|nr:uracil DNA glycosylase [Coemansia erecta]